MAKDEEQAPQGEEEEKGGGKKKLLMILLPVLALGGGGYFFFMGGSGEEAPTETTVVAEGEVIQADTLTVNLVGEAGRYARIGYALVLAEGANQTYVSGRLPLLQDAALTVMTGFAADEITSQTGLDRLRQELTDAAHTVYPDGEVLYVVVTESLVQ